MTFDVRSVLGIPFLYGGRDRSGMDCYGVIQEYYRQNGTNIENLPTCGEPVDPNQPNWEVVVGAPKVGDVVTFSEDESEDAVTHCGVLLKDSKVLHAVENRGVKVTPLRYFKQRIRKYYRRCPG